MSEKNSASAVPQHMNPVLDPELEREVAFFMKWGYLLVEEGIDQDQVEMLRRALDEVCEKKPEQFIHALLEEDERFDFLLDNPPVLQRVKAILGNCIQLHSATARITEPGTPDQDWHRDGPWPMDPEGTPYGSLPGQINCLYFLDELTMQNGPTAVVPGSQRALFRPPAGHPQFPDEQLIFARPGQVVMIDGWIFHRGLANRSQARRRGCYMCYQNAWMKSRESFDGPRVRKLQESGTPDQQLLLGSVQRW